jgi:hypothetical protein
VAGEGVEGSDDLEGVGFFVGEEAGFENGNPF